MRKNLLHSLIQALFPGIVGAPTPIVFNGALPDQAGLMAAIANANPMVQASIDTAINTTAFTLSGSQICGGVDNFLILSGALAAGANLTLPTVAALIAALPSAALQAAPVGLTYKLRIINNSSGAFAWTVTTNTGWTLSGTETIAQDTFRDFVITIASLTTATITSVGSGTN